MNTTGVYQEPRRQRVGKLLSNPKSLLAADVVSHAIGAVNFVQHPSELGAVFLTVGGISYLCLFMMRRWWFWD